MTPSLPDIVRSYAIARSSPLPAEAAGAYTAGRAGILSMLAMLAAQEAERGIAATLWENAALRALFADAAGAWDGPLGGALARAAAARDEDMSLSALTAANADLRRSLIALHEAVEAASDAALDRRILALYVEMAAARHLDLGA